MRYFLLTILCSLSFQLDARDLSILQSECAELGFKLKTADNGNCVLKLLDKINAGTTVTKSIAKPPSENDIEEAQKRLYARQQQYQYDSELIRKQREIDELKRQQEEMVALQRRSVVAQESAAKEQGRANGLNLMLNGLQMMGGTGAYARPAPRAPVTCITTGNIINCN